MDPTTIVIVLPDAAAPLQTFAAQELARWLHDRYSVRVPILNQLPQEGDRYVIRLNGPGDERHPEGYHLMAHAGGVNVAGADPSGTLYGVRDLCHYYWGSPDLDIRSAPHFPRRGFQTWDYYLGDPYAYIDRCSEWKINWLSVCGQPFILEHKDMIPYAHSRGLKFCLAMGIFSWEFTGIAVHNASSWLPAPAPPYLKRNAEGTVLCPSEPDNVKWTIDQILGLLDELPGVDAFYFQTGILDFADCDCDKCRAKAADEIFVQQANPIIEAVLNAYPQIWVSYGLSVAQIHNPEFAPAMKQVDPRAPMLGEARVPIYTDEDIGAMREGVPEGTGWGWIGKCYGQDRLIRGWRERRNEYIEEIWKGAAKGYEAGIPEFHALVETHEYCKRQLFVPAVWAEIAWDGGEGPFERFAYKLSKIRAITDLDQRVSDPPATTHRKADQVDLIKRLEGTLPEGGWDWGVLRIGSRQVGDVCDLLAEGESGMYTFRLPEHWESASDATLIIQGALDWLPQPEAPYEVQVRVNGLRVDTEPSTWSKGERVIHSGTATHYEICKPTHYAGKSEWTLQVPVEALTGITEVSICYPGRHGLVMFDRIVLRLELGAG